MRGGSRRQRTDFWPPERCVRFCFDQISIVAFGRRLVARARAERERLTCAAAGSLVFARKIIDAIAPPARWFVVLFERHVSDGELPIDQWDVRGLGRRGEPRENLGGTLEASCSSRPTTCLCFAAFGSSRRRDPTLRHEIAGPRRTAETRRSFSLHRDVERRARIQRDIHVRRPRRRVKSNARIRRIFSITRQERYRIRRCCFLDWRSRSSLPTRPLR